MAFIDAFGDLSNEQKIKLFQAFQVWDDNLRERPMDKWGNLED